MPFHLWPAQVEVMWDFLSCRLILILKARQLGISWISCAYALWLCLFHRGKVVLLFSKGLNEANELLRRVRVLYERLPEWMKASLPALERNNTRVMEWSNGSRVESHPATQSAGRSLTASLVILDEAAFLKWATALYTALKPTIDAGGQIVILSTANGVGNLFHRLWTKAAQKLNKFRAIFLPWWTRPGRDDAWYRDVVAEADDPGLVPQEYPASPSEAFVATGRIRFKAAWIHRLAERILNATPQALPDEALPPLLRWVSENTVYGMHPALSVYELPQPGLRHILAADPAEGKTGGDYSAATLIAVLPSGKRREVAVLHGHFEPGEFGRLLAKIGAVYDAEIIVERNNHGHAVLLQLSLDNYPKIVCGPDGAPGWLSTAQSKPLSIDALAEALKDDDLDVKSAAAVDEMQVYAVLKGGKTGAPSGYHDDLVTTWALANIIARFAPTESEGDEWDDEEEEISSF